MSVILGARPDHGFDEPLGLLSDCHRRIERFLGALLAVCTLRRGGRLDAAERNVLLRATEYFRVAAPRHTQDEEESLFPQLRASPDPRVPGAMKSLQRLEAEHESADRRHREVDALVGRWLESGTLDASAAQNLVVLLTDLQEIYREHIALEDNQIFPLAASVLTAEQIRQMGSEMAQRRGIAPASQGSAGRHHRDTSVRSDSAMKDEIVSDWDPRSETVRSNPLSAYDEMRETVPVAYSDLLGWSLFRHADVLRVLHDPATFSSQVSRHLSVPSGMDAPQHTPYRKLIEPYFSEARMTAFEPACRSVVRELFDSLHGGRELECMSQMAMPLAVRMQCAFLNWPMSMHEELTAWMRENQAAVFAEDQDKLAHMARRFVDAIRSVVRSRVGDANDVTGELLRESVDGRPLHERELVSILRNWTAGEVGTLSAAIGILIRYLAAHPEIQQRLRDEPSGLPYAIDEILRIEGPLVSNRRISTRPVEFDDRRIEAGQRITIIWTAANRDGRAFDGATHFRWNRDQSMNLLYGAGIHVCPGAPLARLELRVIMEQLLAATNRIELGAETPQPATYPAGGYARVPTFVTWR